MLKQTALPVDANGWLPEKDYKALRREIARHCGKAVTIETKRYVKPRSNQQNRAVMGLWLGIIMKETGHHEHEKEGLYQAIKTQCWYREIVSKKTGEVIREPKETKHLDSAEYSQFMLEFRAFVLDFFDIHLPDPVRSLAYI